MSACPGRGRSLWSRLRLLPFAVAIWAAVLCLVAHGCNGMEGDFVSTGAPLGDFRFVPKTCRSGQRLNFFGAVLLGERPGEGGLMLIDDAVQGKIVKVEVPGSCQPPEHLICTEVTVDPRKCATYDVHIQGTGGRRESVARMEGHLRLDCRYPDGGRIRADLEFSGCD